MCLNPVSTSLFKGKHAVFMPVACGKCVECQIKHNREWTYRIMLEAKQYTHNCFITLTYNDENLPANGSLCKRDFQLFMKRFRKQIYEKYNKTVRFFACGEYGSIGNRPHYHIILFNFYPDDAYLFLKDKRGNDIYRSPFLEKSWSLGFSSVGFLDFESAKYCAKYVQKSLNYNFLHLEKPFTLMSRRPGIGFNAINPDMLSDDKIYLDGKYISLPRYFLDVLSRQGYENAVNKLKFNRLKRAYHYFIPSLPHYDFKLKIFYHDYNPFSVDFDTWKKQTKNFYDSLEQRRKKFLNIFGNSLDKYYRLC